MGFKENGFESSSPKLGAELEIFFFFFFFLGVGVQFVVYTNLQTYTQTHISTHTHTQFSIFHCEILKIKCFIELNSSFTIFYSEILKIFILNINYKLSTIASKFFFQLNKLMIQNFKRNENTFYNKKWIWETIHLFIYI